MPCVLPVMRTQRLEAAVFHGADALICRPVAPREILLKSINRIEGNTCQRIKLASKVIALLVHIFGGKHGSERISRIRIMNF